MKGIIFVLLLLCICGAYQDHPNVPDYKVGGMPWPLPSQITQTSNQYVLSPSTFTFGTSGQSNTILLNAFKRYQKLCFPDTYLNAKLSEKFIPNAIDHLDANVAQASESDQIQFGTDESYTLDVTSTVIQITSKTVYGAIRGLETFSQLIVHSSSSYTINETKIQDAPRFPWRGLLIDTSRHYLPVQTILDTISAMSYNKLNTLHWHIVDGQSFPYESKVYPLLSQQGAYRSNMIYSQDEVKNIISFANDHGIRILPEFDMPAHSTSWGFGYDYMTIKCYTRRDPYDFNDGWGDDPMDPTNPQVYDLIQNFLIEANSIFPDNWIHLGGDEINYNCWNTTEINNYMKQHNIQTYNELEAMFIKQINSFIKSKFNKKMAYWQEVFQETSPFIGTAVDVWKDANTLSNVIAKGINAIQSFGWYLDNLSADWLNFYRQDPIPSKTPPDQEKLVLGGETSMWGETVDVTNIHQKVWPRASAVAERLWSPQNVRNETSAIARLSQHRCRMFLRGIPAAPFQPGPGCY